MAISLADRIAVKSFNPELRVAVRSCSGPALPPIKGREPGEDDDRETDPEWLRELNALMGRDAARSRDWGPTLTRELEAVANAKRWYEGDCLEASAVRVGYFVAAGILSEAEAMADLIEAAEEAGLDDDSDVRATIADAMTTGRDEFHDLMDLALTSRSRLAI